MPVNVEQTAAFAALAKSFTSSYEARDHLANALREHLGVTARDSFWMSDDGIDDVLGPVVIYQFNRDVFDGSGGLPVKASPGSADLFFRATYSRTAGGFVFGEPVAVRRRTDYVRDSAADEGAEPGSDEAELPAWLAVALARAAGLTKGAGHKYIRRVPKSGGGYRYFYKVSGGKGLGHEDEMAAGAKFRVTHGGKDGHFEIVGKDDKGNLRIKHDESGHESSVSPAALRSMLHAEHAQSLTAHRAKLAADIKATDDPKAKARLLAEAGKYEHTKDLSEPEKISADSSDADNIREAKKRTEDSIGAAYGSTSGTVYTWDGSSMDLSFSPRTTKTQMAERVERIILKLGDTPDVRAGVKAVLDAHHKQSDGLVYHGDQKVSWSPSDAMPAAKQPEPAAPTNHLSSLKAGDIVRPHTPSGEPYGDTWAVQGRLADGRITIRNPEKGLTMVIDPTKPTDIRKIEGQEKPGTNVLAFPAKPAAHVGPQFSATPSPGVTAGSPEHAKWDGYDAGHRHATAQGSMSGQGRPAPVNPHAAGTPHAEAWNAGRKQGARDAGGAAREDADRPTPKKPEPPKAKARLLAEAGKYEHTRDLGLGEELHAGMTEDAAKQSVKFYARKGVKAVATPSPDGNPRKWRVHEVGAPESAEAGKYEHTRDLAGGATPADRKQYLIDSFRRQGEDHSRISQGGPDATQRALYAESGRLHTHAADLMAQHKEGAAWPDHVQAAMTAARKAHEKAYKHVPAAAAAEPAKSRHQVELANRTVNGITRSAWGVTQRPIGNTGFVSPMFSTPEEAHEWKRQKDDEDAAAADPANVLQFPAKPKVAGEPEKKPEPPKVAPDAPVARRAGETWDDVAKRHKDIADAHWAARDIPAWGNENDKANAPKAAAAYLDKVATNTHVLQHIADNGLKPDSGMNKHTISVVQAMAQERLHGSGPSPSPSADAKVQKSMSGITDPERDLAKSLAASHRAAAERQPDASARAAHEAAAQACDAAADADGTTDYRKALGAAGRIGGLVKAWSNIPDAQRPPFDDFRKSMTQPPPAARLGAIGFRPSNGTGDAIGGLSKAIVAARPVVEQPTPIEPEANTYSAQVGAVNGLRKSMGAFYDRVCAGATPARLDIRFPPEAPLAKSGGPFIGPHGGKWADAAHTIPWKEPAPAHRKDGTAETAEKDADLAKRIAARPDAYVSRFSSIKTARESALANKVVDGRAMTHRIFMGPSDVNGGEGEFWMTSSATVSRALRAGGYELAAVV